MTAYLVPSIGSRIEFSKPASLKLLGFFHSLDLPSRVLVTVQRTFSSSENASIEEFIQAQFDNNDDDNDNNDKKLRNSNVPFTMLVYLGNSVVETL
jgi:hypothetical protein